MNNLVLFHTLFVNTIIGVNVSPATSFIEECDGWMLVKMTVKS